MRIVQIVGYCEYDMEMWVQEENTVMEAPVWGSPRRIFHLASSYHRTLQVVLWSGPIQYCEISYFHLTSKLWNDLYMMLPIKMSQEAKLGLCELSGVSLCQAGVRGEDLIRALRAALAGAMHSHAAPCRGTITGQRRCSCYLVWFMRKQFS